MRRAVTRYDLISCVNCSLVNCQSDTRPASSSSPLYADMTEPPSLSLSLSLASFSFSLSRSIGRTPRATATVVVVGHRTPLLAHSDSRCPMNALHFHTSPGGQRERLTRLFNPRSGCLLRFVRSFVRSRFSFRSVPFRSPTATSPCPIVLTLAALHTSLVSTLSLLFPLTDALISEKSGARLAPRRKSQVARD